MTFSRPPRNIKSATSIEGAPTSVAAFIGTAPRGIANKAVTISSFSEYEREFGRSNGSLAYQVYQYFQNGGRTAIVVRVSNGRHSTINVGKIKLRTAGPGKIKAFKVRVKYGKYDAAALQDELGRSPKKVNTLFDLVIRMKDSQSEIIEQYDRLSLKPSSKNYISKVLKQSDLVRIKRLDRKRPVKGLYTVQRNGTAGDDGKPVLNVLKAIPALDKTDFNMLCIPPYSQNSTPVDVYSEALQYCIKRRAILIVDPPGHWQSARDADVTELASIRHQNAVIYFPRILVANDEPLEVVPCGTVAGIMARTDAIRGVWKAPAGTEATVKGASGLAVSVSEQENQALNDQGVNCLRNFGGSIVVWGARTLSDDRQWTYVPVRRLALFVEESIYRGTKWAVFEPNDEPLWNRLRSSIEDFMMTLFRQGAFSGSKPEMGFFVKCDKDTTSADDINAGIVNVAVGFAPLRPAEFISLKISIKAKCALCP